FSAVTDPGFGRADSSDEELHQSVVTPQSSLVTMADQGIKRTFRLENLQWIFFHPKPRPHLQTQWKIELLRLILWRMIIEVIPQIPMSRIVLCLRFKSIKMIRISPVQELLQSKRVM